MAVKLRICYYFVLFFLVISLGRVDQCNSEAIDGDDNGDGDGEEKKVTSADERAVSIPKELVDVDVNVDEIAGKHGTKNNKRNEITWDADSSSIKYKKRVAAARQRWKKTFEEIKKIAVDITPESQRSSKKLGTKFFDEWKLFLDGDASTSTSTSTNGANRYGASNNTNANANANSTSVVNDDGDINVPKRKRQRFDGFATWDKMLQQWADESAEYIASHETFGGSEKKSVEALENKMEELVRRDEAEKQRIRFTPRTAREGEEIVAHTDIGDKSKNIWIVTTAALPWMTGTAVNPLLRAAFLTSGRKEKGGKVTLMLPWLEQEKDRDKIYSKDREFDTASEQEECIRTWLREKANLKKASEELNIAWYIGRHETLENSIYSMGDITALIPVEDADICVLEEPEHLNWYRAPGESWTKKFKHVVGIVHTNYFVYAQEQPAAILRAPGMKLLSSWMCRAHCHRIIKLSGTLGKFAPEKELVENVHGVRNTFLDYGRSLSQELMSPAGKNHPVFGPEADAKVYFIGKMLWSKGIGSLMELLKYAQESADLNIDFDMYGGGPNFEEAKQRSEKLGLSMTFHGPIDHAALAPSHKIFVNPSLSEVLCTTVAEALAMGKFVIVPSHPSNDFFAQFPNCLTYANKEEFVGNLYYAMTHSPEPMSEEFSYALSWEAANERFAAAGSITKNEAKEFAEALSSDEGLFEIGLPPLIEDEQRREQVSKTVKNTRRRYREFRSNLADEIRLSNVLPPDVKQLMLKELDKRLDIDVDELLSSPKLKFQLSPAELDRQLLDLYDAFTLSPSADIFRTVLGGANVGRQSYYLKQQAMKEKKNAKLESVEGKEAMPQFVEDVGIGEKTTATTSIKRALRRNLQSTSSFLPDNHPINVSPANLKNKKSQSNRRGSTKMIAAIRHRHPHRIYYTFPKPSFYHHRLSSRLPSLLI